MIVPKRVLQVIEFLEVGEIWTVMADRGYRLAVFGVENDIVKMSMDTSVQSVSRYLSLTDLKVSRLNPEDVLGRYLVRMIADLGGYVEETLYDKEEE